MYINLLILLPGENPHQLGDFAIGRDFVTVNTGWDNS